MEQKHTIEENGYYSQVTDQLIENIGYQMIRRNWSMKTLADKADLPYETVKHLMAGKIGRPSFISILKIANARNVRWMIWQDGIIRRWRHFAGWQTMRMECIRFLRKWNICCIQTS